MTDTAKDSFGLLKAKSTQVFDPSFFGSYSFEYAYRLFLVYLSTNKAKIKDIRVDDPDALDHIFEGDIASAIAFIAKYRGASLDEQTIAMLTKIANDSVVLYAKSPMSNPPIAIAQSVARAMDKQAAEYLGDGQGVVVPSIFSEERA